MKGNELHEQVEGGGQQPIYEQPEQLKINLINSNTLYFRKLLHLSIKFACSRLLTFVLIIVFEQQFIISQKGTNSPDSWNIIFYVLASMMDFLGTLNDVQMIKYLDKDEIVLQKIKTDLANKEEIRTYTEIGSYTYYLSIYDIIKKYKYRSKSSISISQTIRFLHVIITIYIFGNLAIRNEYKAEEGQFFKAAFLWLFILSIYVNVFQMDYFIFQSSDGPFIERKITIENVSNNSQKAQSPLQKLIKDRFISQARRPFEIIYIISIILMFTEVVIFFNISLLKLMLSLCIGCHFAELIHQKYLQNSLFGINLSSSSFTHLSSYKILAELIKKNPKTYKFIRCLNRIVIILTIFSYFREQEATLLQSLLFALINFFLFIGQYIKFSRLQTAKLYVLSRDKIPQSVGNECSICLLQFKNNEKLLSLPCFSQHIFHYQCMKSWLSERKQCPLCRYSLQIYQLE